MLNAMEELKHTLQFLICVIQALNIRDNFYSLVLNMNVMHSKHGTVEVNT